jgi:hypothetical protein
MMDFVRIVTIEIGVQKVMSPDAALVIFTSLGFASIFLALVVRATVNDPADLVLEIANMTPIARRSLNSWII